MCLFSLTEALPHTQTQFSISRMFILGYSSSYKGYKCLSSSWRIYISKDVFFNELRFPYSDMFPFSSNPIKNLDSYFSLNLNLSLPSVTPTPQSFQLSLSHSPFVSLVPPGFSPIPAHSPINSIFVSHPSTSSEPISIQPQISQSTTPSASTSKVCFSTYFYTS